MNVIHTANPIEHANHIAAQPQFVHPVHHTFVDLSGHNLANPHPFSGKNSQSQKFCCFFFFPGVKLMQRLLGAERLFFPPGLNQCVALINVSSFLVPFCCCPNKEKQLARDL